MYMEKSVIVLRIYEMVYRGYWANLSEFDLLLDMQFSSVNLVLVLFNMNMLMICITSIKLSSKKIISNFISLIRYLNIEWHIFLLTYFFNSC